MEMKVYATAIVEKEGKILLVQEAKEKSFQKWNYPGGTMEVTEKAWEAAKREVLEETKLEVEITALLGVYNSIGKNHSIRFVFVAKPIAGTEEAGDNILAVKWVDPTELKDLDPAHYVNPLVFEAAVADYIKGIRYPIETIREMGNHNK